MGPCARATVVSTVLLAWRTRGAAAAAAAPDEKNPAARLRPGPKTTFFSLRATRYARGGIVGWMRSR